MGEGSRQRVLDALTGKIPDKVPYMYSTIHKNIREAIIGEKITYKYPLPRADFGSIGVLGEPAIMEPAENIDVRVAEKLGLDALGMRYLPPFYVNVGEGTSGLNVMGGLLLTPDTLDKIILPDPDDEKMYQPALEFCQRYKGEYALYAQIRLGVSFMMNSMGLEEFAYNTVDEPDFVKGVMEKYTKWVSRLVTNLQECGFDFLWTFDDMAYKKSLMFSPATWDEFFAPYLRESVSHIHVPWVFHSDGNLMPILDKLIQSCVPAENRKAVNRLVANERYHYIEPHHGRPILNGMWEIGQATQNQNVLEIEYEKLKGHEVVTRTIEPVGLMFSEYYFYLVAFLRDINKKEAFENPDDIFPTIYRVDRILNFRVLPQHFRVPYQGRFEEGEFRKRVQFMYGGKLQKIRFRYVGPSIEAVLDRLPTAQIIEQDDEGWTVEAEVFGKGIEMWLRSQGDYVQFNSITPSNL